MHRYPANPAPSRGAACRWLGTVVVAVALGGCGATVPPEGRSGAASTAEIPDLWPDGAGQPASGREGCQVDDRAAQAGGSFVFALVDSVMPTHAPVPRNRSERVVFGHLYETLVRVDCEGRAQPGLASSWTCGADSTVWVFTLRDNAATWDGERITAADVWRSWVENRDAMPDDGTAPWNWFDPRTGSVTALDARRLSVRLPEPQEMFPVLLAHPATALAIRRTGWTWPVGSGPCQLRPADRAPRPDLVCRPNPRSPRVPTWSTLTFRVEPGRNLRDLAAGAPDLMLTRDLAAVDFYNKTAGYRTRPMPWDRVYLMVCPPGMDADVAARWFEAAAALDPARDLTGVAAHRWPALTLPAADGHDCPQLSGPVSGAGISRFEAEVAAAAPDQRTLVFPEGDLGGRELAAQLSAMAGADTRSVMVSRGAAAAVLHRGDNCASLLPLPQAYSTGCLQLAALLGRAFWLQQLALAHPNAAATLAQAGVVAPVVVTRAWLVIRGELSGISLSYDAIPELSGLGAAAVEVRP